MADGSFGQYLRAATSPCTLVLALASTCASWYETFCQRRLFEDVLTAELNAVSLGGFSVCSATLRNMEEVLCVQWALLGAHWRTEGRVGSSNPPPP